MRDFVSVLQNYYDNADYIDDIEEIHDMFSDNKFGEIFSEEFTQFLQKGNLQKLDIFLLFLLLRILCQPVNNV